MELQEPVLKAAITEIRFDPTPRFPEARSAIIERLRDTEGLENWTMSEQFLQLFTEADPSAVLQVSLGNISASFENLDADDCRRATRRTIETALDELKLKSVNYIGVRSMWLAASNDFDELQDGLIETMGLATTTFLEPVGQKPSDSGWVFEFRKTEPEHVLRLGPMRQEQAAAQIFRDKEPDNYPPQFLFLDLDRQCKTLTTGGSAVIDRWSSTFDRCLEVAQLVMTRLRSLL